MKRHIVRAGITAAAIAGLSGGCQSKPQPQNLQSAAAVQQQPLANVKPPAPAPVPPEPVFTPDPKAAASQALIYKAQSYTREMEPLLKNHAKKAGDPTDVDFLDPSDFRLGGPAVAPTIAPAKKAEPAVQVVAIAHPVTASTPTLTNQGTALASGGSADAQGAAAMASSANYPRSINDTVTERAPIPTAKGNTAADLDPIVTRNLKEYPKDVWAHLDYQLLQFLRDKPTPQLDALAPLAAQDRELVAAVMDGLTNFRNAVRADNNMLLSRKVRPLLELAERVRAQADLIIPTMTLCTRVDGFGVYEPVEPARFTAMKEHPIIVYCEVQNFASHQNANRMWETKLSQECVLYTETGLPVWQDKTENIPDLARQLRHDFFVVKKTKFPANITIGRYILKVTIVDQQANRVTEATLPVLFVAQ
jgi:hypothetical protein